MNRLQNEHFKHETKTIPRSYIFRFIPKYIPKCYFFDIFQLNSLTYHEPKVTDSFITNFNHAHTSHIPSTTCSKQVDASRKRTFFHMTSREPGLDSER